MRVESFTRCCCGWANKKSGVSELLGAINSAIKRMTLFFNRTSLKYRNSCACFLPTMNRIARLQLRCFHAPPIDLTMAIAMPIAYRSVRRAGL